MSTYAEKNRKTKRLIQQSFIRILERKPFESITVGDIAKEAAVNRGTFYLHYEDKYDLLAQMERQLFEDLGRQIDELQAGDPEGGTVDEKLERLAEALFRFIELHAPVLNVFFSGHGRAGFHYRFRDALAEKVGTSLEKDAAVRTQLSAPLDYFISFMTSAFLGLIEQWVRGGLDKTPKEMTGMYREIVAFIRGSRG